MSNSEENYIKEIYKLSLINSNHVTTNEIAYELSTKPPSVSDMLKKLCNKKLISYQKYKGVNLTSKGQNLAIYLTRKHRLWEFFLVNCLKYNWDEVHNIAEQLEHVKSEDLINRLDNFLGFPKIDPHGEPIPDKNGVLNHLDSKSLDNLGKNNIGKVVGVKTDDSDFLKYLNKINISIGSKLKIIDFNKFDHSFEIQIKNRTRNISLDVAKNILILC